MIQFQTSQDPEGTWNNSNSQLPACIPIRRRFQYIIPTNVKTLLVEEAARDAITLRSPVIVGRALYGGN